MEGRRVREVFNERREETTAEVVVVVFGGMG